MAIHIKKKKKKKKKKKTRASERRGVKTE